VIIEGNTGIRYVAAFSAIVWLARVKLEKRRGTGF